MKRRLTIELDEALYEKLKRVAKRKRLSMGAVIRLLILDHLEDLEGEK